MLTKLLAGCFAGSISFLAATSVSDLQVPLPLAAGAAVSIAFFIMWIAKHQTGSDKKQADISERLRVAEVLLSTMKEDLDEIKRALNVTKGDDE